MFMYDEKDGHSNYKSNSKDVCALQYNDTYNSTCAPLKMK